MWMYVASLVQVVTASSWSSTSYKPLPVHITCTQSSYSWWVPNNQRTPTALGIFTYVVFLDILQYLPHHMHLVTCMWWPRKMFSGENTTLTCNLPSCYTKSQVASNAVIKLIIGLKSVQKQKIILRNWNPSYGIVTDIIHVCTCTCRRLNMLSTYINKMNVCKHALCVDFGTAIPHPSTIFHTSWILFLQAYFRIQQGTQWSKQPLLDTYGEWGGTWPHHYWSWGAPPKVLELEYQPHCI